MYNIIVIWPSKFRKLANSKDLDLFVGWFGIISTIICVLLHQIITTNI